MGRIAAHSQEQVFEAADKLAANGQEVTPNALRDVLGRGSYSTLLKHIDAWQQARQAAPAPVLIEMPESVKVAQLDAAKSTAAIAWGWLWHVTTADDRVKTARHLLARMLDKDLKRYGIQTAKAEGAHVNVQEIEASMLRGEFGDA